MSERTTVEKSFKISLPYILLVIGLISYSFSVFGTFQNGNWQRFLEGIGKSILVSGIFAIVLKSIQFMGVFKDELSDIIYKQKYLDNRKDIKEVWENVSKIIFKNKFPKISKSITGDIENIYFPTKHVLYYDEYKQTLEIELIDPVNEKIRVKQHSEYIVYPTSKNDKLNLKTQNTLRFNKSKEEVGIKIQKFTVNGKDIEPVIDQKIEASCLRTWFTVVLTGEESYKFETIIEKEYSLKYDRIIGTKKDYIIHDFNLKILLKGELKINFLDAGTFNNFKPANVINEHYREYDYRGIIYPKQGYILVVEKK